MKRDTKVSLPYQQILHKQVIDENSPGTVLRDFETLLEFISQEDVNVILSEVTNSDFVSLA